MFFFIGADCKLLEKANNGLFLDKGWTNIDNVWYKGYTVEGTVASQLHNIRQGYQPEGIWAVIELIDTYQVYHSKMRGFPIYKKENESTNLNLDGFTLCTRPYNEVNSTETLTISQVTVEVQRILTDSCLNYYQVNNQPLEIFVSGGYDTTLIMAICEFNDIPYRAHITSNKTIEYTTNLIEFCQETYWAYNFLSIFEDRKITCGFYGDEVMCRNIWQLRMLANSKSKTLREVVVESDYVYKFVNRLSHQYLLDLTTEYKLVKQEIMNSTISNQVWHIDNTEVFCPYLNYKIFTTMLKLSVEDLLKVGPNALIQHAIIKSYNPGMERLLDEYKNTTDTMKNFLANFNSLNLKNCVELILT